MSPASHRDHAHQGLGVNVSQPASLPACQPVPLSWEPITYHGIRLSRALGGGELQKAIFVASTTYIATFRPNINNCCFSWLAPVETHQRQATLCPYLLPSYQGTRVHVAFIDPEWGWGICFTQSISSIPLWYMTLFLPSLFLSDHNVEDLCLSLDYDLSEPQGDQNSIVAILLALAYTHISAIRWRPCRWLISLQVKVRAAL